MLSKNPTYFSSGSVKRLISWWFDMPLFVQYDTECLSCGKPMKCFHPDTFISYKKQSVGANICKDCRKFQIKLDINKIIKNHI